MKKYKYRNEQPVFATEITPNTLGEITPWMVDALRSTCPKIEIHLTLISPIPSGLSEIAINFHHGPVEQRKLNVEFSDYIVYEHGLFVVIPMGRFEATFMPMREE